MQAGHTDSGKPCSSHQSPAAWNAAISDGSHWVHFDSGSACSRHQSTAIGPAPSPRARGLQIGQTDSGRPCPSHQSPAALKPAIKDGSHRVHLDSGTPCSPHQSPWGTDGARADSGAAGRAWPRAAGATAGAARGADGATSHPARLISAVSVTRWQVELRMI